MSQYIQLTLDLGQTPPIQVSGPGADVVLTTGLPQVTVQADAPTVSIGVPGQKGATGATGSQGPVGATGATGLVKVAHGANPNLARPSAPLVYWVGTVQPVHANPDDLLLLEGS